MNWTLPNSTQTSPGFVYFNNSEPNNHDFIAFSDSPPPASQQQKFGPQGYSTPQHHHQQNRRNYHKQRNNWNQNRFAGRNNRSFNSATEAKFDNNYLIKAKFVHQSFLENPWAELEQKLEQERKNKQENAGNSSPPQAETTGRKRSRDMCD